MQAQPVQLKPMEPLICNVCFEAWSPESILALPCRHCFCKVCARAFGPVRPEGGRGSAARSRSPVGAAV